MIKRNRFNIKHLLVGERGQTTVLVVCFMPIFILLMGWSVDVGRLLSAKTELDKATDISAQEVANSIDMKEAQESGLQIRYFSDKNAQKWIEKNIDDLCGGQLTQISIKQDENYVYIESEAIIPLLFSSIVGKSSTSIRARGIGRLKTIKQKQNWIN